MGEDTQHQLLGTSDRNNWPVGDEMTAATYTLNQVQFSGPGTLRVLLEMVPFAFPTAPMLALAKLP